MSYDIYIHDEDDEEVFSRNHTSNTSQMWKEAGVNLQEFEGKPASELVDPLTAAILDIVLNKRWYRKYEPANGWGDVDSTIAFLSDVLDACEQTPNGTLRVSW